jgi:hypothetical protein
MNRLASGIRPEGPDGRVVPTFLWRDLPLRHCRTLRPPQGYTPKLKLP